MPKRLHHETPELDMTKGKDRNIVTAALKRRWPVSDEVKVRLLEQCAKHLSANELDARELAGIGRVLAALESQNQADEHLADKNDRIDAGKATESHDHRTYQVEFGD